MPKLHRSALAENSRWFAAACRSVAGHGLGELDVWLRESMRPADQRPVYSVSTNVELAQSMTSDVRRLQQPSRVSASRTVQLSLYDALFDAARLFEPYADGASWLSCPTQRHTSRLPEHRIFDNTLQRLLSDDCQVYVDATGIYDNANVRDLAAERRMQESRHSGGPLPTFPNP